ncbi:hypothetical protein P171DRAFT_478305 [Karstenula rhodostoma CBS 690.94]|uniref:Uncharacterized protein n=1 Tax=Karstenula rhodostoma CBS 690.94 TaxID=1392251 RepID=A0A9P4PW09_9PLEO|nr:hypothetical protein P171DRAFT_478305 [Karstenula rhodostoma CBS 690.94]
MPPNNNATTTGHHHTRHGSPSMSPRETFVIYATVAAVGMYAFCQLVEFVSYRDANGNLKYGAEDVRLVSAILYLLFGW